MAAFCGENFAMGLDGGLPWPRLKGDLKMFQDYTTPYPIIEGWKTALSIGKPLPERINIILTANKNKILGSGKWDRGTDQDKVLFYNDLPRAINDFRGKVPVISLIGGAQVFEQALQLGIVDEMILTETYRIYKGDVFFPKFNKDLWHIQPLKDLPQPPYEYKVTRYYR